ncbi:FAD-dependent oxidoreductase [Vibrio algivorus]|uniref:Oxidoreductase n=1 Tax=Vibrio algivorus TaxID=1667024 RepID=A0ABQ6EN20_9VIBR|nr:FAD-dependent oxidoreductase [Vibrio algivorus]GLT14096.1 oxidoreductase [Vibrio algivorus]
MASPHIGIIGGGIAGATAALHFADLGLQVSIFEQGASLVDGPPICHLHAGGNLYREISQQQCVQLLKESIETVKLYKHTMNVRPTVIAVPTQDKGQPEDLLPRLQVIKQAYQSLVEQDASNQVLGDPQRYFKLYSQQELEALAQCDVPEVDSLTDQSLDEWMIPFAKSVDLNTLKFPVVLVQEYGLSVFRLSATVNLALAQLPNCQIYTNTQVIGVQPKDKQWVINYKSNNKHSTELPEAITVDYLINASGYQTGVVDDWVKAPRSRLVEFKAAYVTHWQEGNALWPEVIFHGERGTPQGMAQLTPYPDGYFQLHGMTEDITLFEDGIAHSTDESSQPKLPEYLVNKIIHGWSKEQQTIRTNKAIKHMAQFIPSFASATLGGKPLFGAQQIPGTDITLRAASVSFAGDNYARMEIVKASSALEAAQQIEQQMRECGFYDELHLTKQNISSQLTIEQVIEKACTLAEQRSYPTALAKVGGVK